uniref:Arabinanase/levansucrase/invertase n=1 Tax=Kalanchoe fedtschenkoi TaxID=63787 RepID=A0A7N0V4S8_KALFE
MPSLKVYSAVADFATSAATRHLLPGIIMPKSINISPSSILRPHPCPCSKPSTLHLLPCRRSFNCSSFTYPKLTHGVPHCSTNPNLDNGTAADKHALTSQNLSLGAQQNESQNPDSGESRASSPSSSVSSVNSHGLVFGLGSLGSWDSGAVGSPVVKRFLSDEEERWYMWYHGSSSEDPMGKDIVGLAVSSNGIHWERGKGGVQSADDVGMVLNVSEDWWALDTHSIRPAEVVIMSSSKIRGSSAVYWLYYTGYSNSEQSSVLSQILNSEISKMSLLDDQVKVVVETGRVCKSLPGLAMSQDGRHWARLEGEHHSGALFDVGSETEWDSAYISSPQVVFHQPGDLRMYYHSYDAKKSHFAVGVARSRDGMNWIKLGKVLGAGAAGTFDELGAMNACVVKSNEDGTYFMAYEAVNATGGRSLGLAASADGLRAWKRVGGGPILEPGDGDSWDNGGVGSPCLVHMEGEASEWRVYYTGVGRHGRSGIGMAVSAKGSVTGGFERWKGFHL